MSVLNLQIVQNIRLLHLWNRHDRLIVGTLCKNNIWIQCNAVVL